MDPRPLRVQLLRHGQRRPPCPSTAASPSPVPPALPPVPTRLAIRAPSASENNYPAFSAPLLLPTDALLERWLWRLSAFLATSGLSTSTPLEVGFAASVLALPAAAVALSPCHDDGTVCDDYEVELLEVSVLIFQAAAAAVAVACVSRKMTMYGLRKFLFVDPELGLTLRFQKEYAARIQHFSAMVVVRKKLQ